MKHQKTLLALALLASAATSVTAQASLVDHGNGLLYDNVLNVIWLQDANYAETSGYSATGQMDWATATTWAANLNFDGLTGWRLATNTPVNGSSFNTNFSYDGTTDSGYNITSPHSELSYMYYVNLGLKGYFDAAGNPQSDWGIFGNGTYNGVNTESLGQNNVGLVNNLQSNGYWSGAEFSPGSGDAWVFFTYAGLHSDFSDNRDQFYAWAVRPGDVSAVPVPSAVWLFGSGLLGLLGFKRLGNIG
jgi:hypothetical protein